MMVRRFIKCPARMRDAQPTDKGFGRSGPRRKKSTSRRMLAALGFDAITVGYSWRLVFRSHSRPAKLPRINNPIEQRTFASMPGTNQQTKKPPAIASARQAVNRGARSSKKSKAPSMKSPMLMVSRVCAGKLRWTCEFGEHSFSAQFVPPIPLPDTSRFPRALDGNAASPPVHARSCAWPSR